ncbi:MFS transporter [Brevibacillus sp. SYSU BS000544]|uniref:MFS transporter n=1 Tax=Brevibacillus sp. SYSU BS000544 TaxID=3416443 RepID=UPI003CE5719A
MTKNYFNVSKLSLNYIKGEILIIRNKTFILLMIGEIISGAGAWIGLIANLQFMQELVPSDFFKSLILMSGLFVSVLLAPKAGVIIDRTDKKHVIFLASLFRCISPICMFPAIAYDSIAWMVVSMIFVQTAAGFYFPALQASIPAVVRPDELLKANGIYLNISTLARIGGTAVGGVLLTMMSLTTLYSLTLISYAILACISLATNIPSAHQQGTKERPKIRFMEVFSIIRQEPSVLVSMANMGVITLFLGGINLLIMKFSQIQQDPGLMGWIYAVEGSSILIAGLLAKRWIGGRNLVTSSTLLVLVFAVSLYGMSYAESKLIVLSSFGLFGFTVGFFFPMITTIFQKRLAPDAQGRFFSFKGMMDRVLFQIALLMTGACLDLIGATWYMTVLGFITLITGIVSYFYVRKKSIDVRQYQESTASLSA